MLQPARRKYRKEQKGRNTGIATRGSSVAFGDFGLKCTDRGRLTARQIEAARRAISRRVKRGGKAEQEHLYKGRSPAQAARGRAAQRAADNKVSAAGFCARDQGKLHRRDRVGRWPLRQLRAI